MSKAMTMSSHCSGCGSIELALRFIAAAWSGGAVPFQLRMSSCCAHPLVKSAPSACPLVLHSKWAACILHADSHGHAAAHASHMCSP